MINFTYFTDLISWFREYFLIIWPEIIDFKPIGLTSLGEKDPDTGNGSDADRESRDGGAEEAIEKS
ncbi:MAG TPA: hypothetical protein VN373_05135 [Methanosarcina barkeri]|nr:hypothetical protein [Methanosarcina barkeri]